MTRWQLRPDGRVEVDHSGTAIADVGKFSFFFFECNKSRSSL